MLLQNEINNLKTINFWDSKRNIVKILKKSYPEIEMRQDIKRVENYIQKRGLKDVVNDLDGSELLIVNELIKDNEKFADLNFDICFKLGIL